MFSACILLLIIFIIYFNEYFRLVYYAAKIPGPRAWPIVGNTFLLHGKELVKVIVQLHEKYGNFKLWAGPFPMVFISEPDDVQTLFSNSDFTRPSWIMQKIMRNNQATNILPFSTGINWRNKRKIIASGLTTSIINLYLPIFDNVANILIEKMDKEIIKSEPFLVGRYFGQATFDSIFETVLNIGNCRQETKFKFFQADRSDFKIAKERVLKTWLQFHYIFKFSALSKIHQENQKIKNDLITQIIDEWKTQKTERISNNGAGRRPVLDYFIEMMHINGDMTYGELRDEINFLIGAGYATTAIILSFILVMLGEFQDVQQKVYEELTNVFGYTNKPVTANDLEKLNYLRLVIQETLRLFSTIPYIQRQTTTDIQLKNFMLPRGSDIFISIIQIHRDEKHWKNPNKFEPERFLSYNQKDRHRFAYFPFSAGSRVCPGEKYAMTFMQVMLAKFLLKYKVDTDLKLDELRLTFDITLRLIGGHLIRISSRNEM